MALVVFDRFCCVWLEFIFYCSENNSIPKKLKKTPIVRFKEIDHSRLGRKRGKYRKKYFQQYQNSLMHDSDSVECDTDQIHSKSDSKANIVSATPIPAPQPIPPLLPSQPKDEDDLFGEMIVQQLKSFTSPYKKDLLKVKVQQLIMEVKYSSQNTSAAPAASAGPATAEEASKEQ